LIIPPSTERIAKITEEIINEAGPDCLLLGITEDVPEERWWVNYSTIVETIDRKFNVNNVF
jgi:hypothetical protein